MFDCLNELMKNAVNKKERASASEKLIEHELGITKKELRELANFVYDEDDFSSPLASGSFITDAMIIIPCSMKTLSQVASGLSDNLIGRSAEICLKERRKLVIVPRETPLSLMQLKNMVSVTEAGAIVLPACPAFYSRPQGLEDLFDVIVGRVLDLIGVENNLYPRWKGNAYNGLNQSEMR